MKRILLSFVLILMSFSFIIQTNAQNYNCDSISFETYHSQIFMDTNNNNNWQIGSPQKSFFSNAHSGTKAIVTDTLNTYSTYDTSSFTYLIYQWCVGMCATRLRFWHKYDMDTIGDKGIIEVSYDLGNSWSTLKDTSGTAPITGPYYFNWLYDYHETSGSNDFHKPIISGKSDGWIRSEYYWTWWMHAKKDTIIINPTWLMIRFTFISDSIINNKDGWMIDDIVVWAKTEGCYDDIEIVEPNSSVILYPNPSSGLINIDIHNFNEATKVEVLNSFGQVILSKNINARSTCEIDISRHTSGMYFLRLSDDNINVLKKIIKQ